MKIVFVIISLFYLTAEARDCAGDKVYYQPPGAAVPDCYCPVGKNMNFNVKGNNAANGTYRVGRCQDSYQSVGYGQTTYDIATPFQIDAGAGNLMMWYDAMDPLGTGYVPPISGLNLPTWYDKSGNGRNMVSTGSSTPKVYLNSWTVTGGTYTAPYYGVYFDGTSKYYYKYADGGGMPTTFPCSSTGYTVGVVLANSGGGTIFSDILNGASSAYVWHHMIVTGGSKFYSGVGGNGQSYGLYSNSNVSATPPTLVVTQANNSNIYLYFGLNSANDATMASSNWCSASAEYNYYIGADQRYVSSGGGTGNGYYNGYITEIVVFKGFLSAANLQKLQNYLYYKNNL